jgi:hypothetical protein
MATPDLPVFWVENILRLLNISTSGLLFWMAKRLISQFEKNTEAIAAHNTEIAVLRALVEGIIDRENERE